MKRSNFTIHYSGEDHSMSRAEVYGLLCQTEMDFDIDAILDNDGWCSAYDETHGKMAIIGDGEAAPEAAAVFISGS